VDPAPSGPWNPGIVSQVPLELRHLCTVFRPENAFTTAAAATELQQLTGLPMCELVAFRPERLLLHELMIRVMADFSVPDGSRIGDLGINFREMTQRLLDRHIAPQLPTIVGTYAEARHRLAEEIAFAFAQLNGAPAPRAPDASGQPRSAFIRLLTRLTHRPQATPRQTVAPRPIGWGPREISECERMATNTDDPLLHTGYRALARVMSAFFTTHGYAWGTPELICRVATDLACNSYGSELIGRLIEPILQQAAPVEGYRLLPKQERPVIINTKGPSASGKSTLRPLQKKLAGAIGVGWRDFALISPDIWRKQLLDYASLGDAFKYAGAFTSEELQIVDQKLDRYMARKQERGEMAHLLIDRFRFDSFAPDSAEAGSNLLTRFGASVYLFFVITPPEQLVERAWMRGLEFGRYKAVDDTLAHGVEAYTGMPSVFFTWVNRTDKRTHIELLDNSVQLGQRPRTVAFGTNYTLNVLDVGKFLDIERFGRVDINASAPDRLYPDRALLAPELNLGFLKRCIQAFEEVNFAEQDTGRIYVRIRSGVPALVDREAFPKAIEDPNTRAALGAIAPSVFTGEGQAIERPQYLTGEEGSATGPTLGEWGWASPVQPNRGNLRTDPRGPRDPECAGGSTAPPAPYPASPTPR
jgi:hypothetical protein